MGRELKRVALAFDWPLNKVWEGYLNPFRAQSIKCEHCDGSGSSPESKYLESLWYGHLGGGFKPEMRGSKPYLPTDKVAIEWATRQIDRDTSGYYTAYGLLNHEEAIKREAERICQIWNSSWSHHLNEQDIAALIKADRLWDFTRNERYSKRKNPAKHPNGWLKRDNGYVPTPREVNDWSLRGFGHDSINCWVVIRAELKRLKQPSTCEHCKGHGHTWPSDRVRRQCAAWKPKEPPKGDGYQIWETVSEGSPISPVFKTPEELATYMANRPWGADTSSSYESWMKFICGDGWAPSFISVPGKGIVSGAEAVASLP